MGLLIIVRVRACVTALCSLRACVCVHVHVHAPFGLPPIAYLLSNANANPRGGAQAQYMSGGWLAAHLACHAGIRLLCGYAVEARSS
jgi:hypothetical protein